MVTLFLAIVLIGSGGEPKRVKVDRPLPAYDCLRIRDMMNDDYDKEFRTIVFTCVTEKQVPELLKGKLVIDPNTGNVLNSSL